MKIYNLYILVAGVILISGCAPNLIVTDLHVTGTPVINAENSFEVPVLVTVQNQGDGSADVFKVSTEYTGGTIDPAREFVVAFTVPGQTDIWYPFTSGNLAPGDQVTYNGNVIFHPAEHGVEISLTATADSCSGDEFMPVYCRVDESDETNNKSTAILLTLP